MNLRQFLISLPFSFLAQFNCQAIMLEESESKKPLGASSLMAEVSCSQLILSELVQGQSISVFLQSRATTLKPATLSILNLHSFTTGSHLPLFVLIDEAHDFQEI
jgi:hypothetical protein